MRSRFDHTLATAALALALLASAARAQGVQGPEAPQALRGAAIGSADGQLIVTLPVDAEVTYLTLDDPPRVVLDVVVESRLPGAPGTHLERVDAWGVRSVRMSQFEPGPERPITRIVLDMDPATFPPPGDAPLVRISRHGSFTRALVRARIDGERAPLVIGKISERMLTQAYGLPHDASPDTPSRGIDLPAAPDSAIAMINKARGTIDYHPDIKTPDLSVDPTTPMISARQARLWDRRAAELIADARLRHVAGDYRTGLSNILKILRYYPSSRHVHEARAVAAQLYAELRFDHEALSHAELVLAAPGAADSLVASVIETASSCPARSVVWRLMERVYRRAEERMGDTEAVRRLGGRAGILLAERGEKVDEAITLIRRALQDDPDTAWAAELHEGFALCHLAQGEPERAARQHFFAAQLLRAEDPARSTSLRLSAADAYFEADDLPRAAEQYGIVADLEIAPDELRAWSLFQLGNCHFRARAFVNAAHSYRRLATEHPSSFWAQQAAARLAVLDRQGVAG